jgi:hypothetical protein
MIFHYSAEETEKWEFLEHVFGMNTRSSDTQRARAEHVVHLKMLAVSVYTMAI